LRTQKRRCEAYFNPRTREGCDHMPKTGTLRKKDFNPRTREGCDRECRSTRQNTRCISIHAPARGATLSWPLPGRVFFYFNPRTREGCDPRQGGWRNSNALFQSTHPRGVRPAMLIKIMTVSLISIHAPARGATGHLADGRQIQTDFNPRTREGCVD